MMGKVLIPEKGKFATKITGALIILLIMIILGALAITDSSRNFGDAFFQSFSIVTHADIDSGGGDNKFLLGALSVLGVVVNFYIVYVILEFLLEGEINRYFRGAKKMKKINNLKNHYVICGGGRVGFHAAKELQKHGKKFVFVEKQEDIAAKLESGGYLVIKGDALDDFNLTKAGIGKASHLLACLSDDADNLLLVMTAHELNSKIITSARAKDEDMVKRLHHAGANYVVLPEVVGGVQLAKSILEEKEDE